MVDIYFRNEYGKLYENLPEEKFEVFEYEDELGKISNRFIKRKIPIDLKDGVKYYDLTTPYGFGGPIIEKINDESQISLLIQNFKNNFQEYTRNNNIVSEFVRFHPVLNNVKHFENLYDAKFDRKTAGTDLTYDDPFMSEFSKSTRKNIRKLLRNELISYEIIEEPDDLKDFMKVYYSTMDRNNAQDRYYFDESYFNEIIRTLKKYTFTVKVYYENIVIGMGLYFKYDKFIHAHLSGTLREYLQFSPAYLLRYALMEYGKSNNFKIIHHGGGTTNSHNDSLYKFKKQFGKNTDFDFYLGKKIWNKKIYKDLCNITKTLDEKDFFPAYRK